MIRSGIAMKSPVRTAARMPKNKSPNAITSNDHTICCLSLWMMIPMISHRSLDTLIWRCSTGALPRGFSPGTITFP
jgi:hypothetical protein